MPLVYPSTTSEGVLASLRVHVVSLQGQLTYVFCTGRNGLMRLVTIDESWGLGPVAHPPIIRGSKIRALRPCFSSIGGVTPCGGGDNGLGVASHRATTQHPCTVNTPAAENLQFNPQRRRHLNLPPPYRIPRYLLWPRSDFCPAWSTDPFGRTFSSPFGLTFCRQAPSQYL
jgi:hypothetical protein